MTVKVEAWGEICWRWCDKPPASGVDSAKMVEKEKPFSSIHVLAKPEKFEHPEGQVFSMLRFWEKEQQVENDGQCLGLGVAVLKS